MTNAFCLVTNLTLTGDEINNIIYYIRGQNHTARKLAMNRYDDKQYILDSPNGIQPFDIGHHRIEQVKYNN